MNTHHDSAARLSAAGSSTPVSRRTVLRSGLCGAAGLLLGKRLSLASTAPQQPPKAKAVIQIWMWGGPSHLDTFDPKPEAGYDYCGPLAKPIPTNVDGILIGELLPLLAQQADKYSIIRSMTHGINAHETASYLVQTGHEPGRQVFPCIGAVVSLLRGYDHGYKGMVPPYVVLTRPQGRFSEAGFLGPKYKPFATGGDPARDPFAVEGIVARGITDKRQRSRRKLLHSLDSLGQAMGGLVAIGQAGLGLLFFLGMMGFGFQAAGLGVAFGRAEGYFTQLNEEFDELLSFRQGKR